MALFTKKRAAIGCCVVAIIFLVMAVVAGKAVQNKKDPTCSCSDVKTTRNICIVVAASALVAGACLVMAARKKAGSNSGNSQTLVI